jgi:hypothetical protein
MNTECGKHSFLRITRPLMDSIIKELTSNGATVIGNNPWTADTGNHGVVLYGSWDDKKSTLLVSVMDKDIFVPCSQIWEVVVPLVLRLRDPEDPSIV